jgi:putative ABC transport system permease protein
MFILVKARAGVNVEELRQRLQGRLTGVDVLTRQQFSDMTRHYWLFTTGAGMAVLMAAVLGLLVGVVVVAQTIYSSTMDHLREFGTLKAMGATNAYIYKIIMKQAAIAAVIGYALGISLSILVVHESGKGGANIILAVATGGGDAGPDRRHVRRRGLRLHQQGHQDRSGHGLQTVGRPVSGAY